MNSKIKPSYDENRQCLGKILPLDTPFTIIIDTSEACNFRCNYCFRSSNNKNVWGYANNALMEWDLFCRIVDQIREFPNKVKTISLSGHGEPLCNKNIPKMVRYIKKNGIKAKVSIHTNASLLNESYVKELAESNIDRIVISLQGINAEEYKDVCGYNIDFDFFYKNLELLYKVKTNTEISIKVADIALKDGEDSIFIDKFSPISDRVFIEKIMPIWENVDLPLEGSEKAFVTNKYGAAFEKQECCPLLFHTLMVIPNGNVYPCTQLLSKEKLGNIKTKSLLELWKSEDRKDLLIKQLELRAGEVCNNCYIKQNSIFTDKDMIDNYRKEILERIQ